MIRRRLVLPAALLLLCGPLLAGAAPGRMRHPPAAPPRTAYAPPPALPPAPAALLGARSLAAPDPAEVSLLQSAGPAATLPSRTQPWGSRDTPGLADGGADSRGKALFDGKRELVSSDGAVFVPSGESHPKVRGTTVFVQSRLGPPAERRPVPGTGGLSGRELLDKLHLFTKQGHKGRKYREASRYLFGTADNIVLGGVPGVVEAYSGIFVPGTSDKGSDYPEKGDQDGDGFPETGGMNIEHIEPQVHFDEKSPMREDLHNMMPTFKHPNHERASLPYGEVRGVPDYGNKAGAKRGGGYFEPPDITKGRVARALLYFYARYKNEPFFRPQFPAARFWIIQIETALRWNRLFPPDVQEMRRNDLVELYQNNRNPFIDDPGLADRIGAKALIPRADPRPGGPPRPPFRRRSSPRPAQTR